MESEKRREGVFGNEVTLPPPQGNFTNVCRIILFFLSPSLSLFCGTNPWVSKPSADTKRIVPQHLVQKKKLKELRYRETQNKGKGDNTRKELRSFLNNIRNILPLKKLDTNKFNDVTFICKDKTDEDTTEYEERKNTA